MRGRPFPELAAPGARDHILRMFYQCRVAVLADRFQISLDASSVLRCTAESRQRASTSISPSTPLVTLKVRS
jgi:hypothetical protein